MTIFARIGMETAADSESIGKQEERDVPAEVRNGARVYRLHQKWIRPTTLTGERPEQRLCWNIT